MIDNKKRQTLKGMAAVASATTVGSIPAFATTGALTDSSLASGSRAVRQVWPPVAVKSPIELSTRVSAINNDIEVVLTNKGAQPVTMTQLTPSKLGTPRGSFDLAEVLQKGPRRLAAGESVTVPIKHHAINGAEGSLQQVIKIGLSVATDADEFAAVSYAVVA